MFEAGDQRQCYKFWVLHITVSRFAHQEAGNAKNGAAVRGRAVVHAKSCSGSTFLMTHCVLAGLLICIAKVATTVAHKGSRLNVSHHFCAVESQLLARTEG
jgi:hypothetical protein